MHPDKQLINDDRSDSSSVASYGVCKGRKAVQMCQQATTVLGLPLSIVVLILINRFYASALDQTQAVVIDSINSRVASAVGEFFSPKITLSHDFEYATKYGRTISSTTDFFEFSDVLAPIFHDDADFLAAYMASSDRQTIKFSAENPGSYLIEHRDYRSEDDQQARKCTMSDTITPMRNCEWQEWYDKPYDPFQKGWWQTANNTASEHVAMDSHSSIPIVWDGPVWQTALAEGDTDLPVFEMLFHITWEQEDGQTVYSNFKAKFLVDVLSRRLAQIDTGAHGLVLVADEAGTVIASPNGDIKKITVDDETGEEVKSFKSIDDYQILDGRLTVEDLTHDTVTRSYNDVAVTTTTLDDIGWKVIVVIQPDEFLEEATRLQEYAAGFSIGSIVLVCIRMVFLVLSVYRKYSSKNETNAVTPVGKDFITDDIEAPKVKEFAGECTATQKE